MAVGDTQPCSKAAPAHSVAFVDTQRAEALARAFETISHVRAAGTPVLHRPPPLAAAARRACFSCSAPPPPLHLQALLTDVVGLYLSRPGCEHPFHHAVFASYLASAPQMVLQCADYGCAWKWPAAALVCSCKLWTVCSRFWDSVERCTGGRLSPVPSPFNAPSRHPSCSLPQLLRHYG